MFPSKLVQAQSKAESPSSFPNTSDIANAAKPNEHPLSFQGMSVADQRAKCTLHCLYTQKVLQDIISNSSEQYLTPISFNRLKALIEVVEQNQQLMTMVAKLEYENLEFKKLIKDTTYMVDVVKELISKHINSNEILAQEPSDMDISYNSDSDGYDSDEHKHKKIKISN